MKKKLSQAKHTKMLPYCYIFTRSTHCGSLWSQVKIKFPVLLFNVQPINCIAIRISFACTLPQRQRPKTQDRRNKKTYTLQIERQSKTKEHNLIWNEAELTLTILFNKKINRIFGLSSARMLAFVKFFSMKNDGKVKSTMKRKRKGKNRKKTKEEKKTHSQFF